MAFNFGFDKYFCANLTTKGNCRQHLNSEENECPVAHIPSPPANSREKWEEILRYIEFLFDLSCVKKNRKTRNWLKEITKKILSNSNRG